VWTITTFCVHLAAFVFSLRIDDLSAQSLVNAFPGISFSVPVDMEAAHDGTNRIFVAERGGRVVLFQNDPSATTKRVFLDVSSKTATSGELGLLGIALHPEFASNGYLFVYYTRPPQTSVIARFTANPSDPDTVLAGSETVILKLAQPASNHNGGKIKFGSDGFLYVAFGDGGGSHDPSGNGQNKETLFGAILRLDVDMASGFQPDCGAADTTGYTIPEANPFRNGIGGDCDEVWAYGFRNPWRFSFDPEGVMWVGDVGQNCREEIDRVFAGRNYGWDIMEGNLCHPDEVDCTLTPPDDCSTDGLELPIIDYDRNSSTGGRSVTGGFVYRGSTCAPFLTGSYVYGDYITDNVWALAFDGDSLVSNTLLLDAGFDVVSFGEDVDGELYVVNAGGNLRKFDCSSLVSLEVPYEEGWQQISVPVSTISMKASDVLSEANLGAPVFGFSDGRFRQVDWLTPGAGYVTYFSTADTLHFVGTELDPRVIPVLEGWNLVGPFEQSVLSGSVTPSGGMNILSPFYELSTGYSSVSALESGRGYWVAVDSDGTLQLP